MQFDELPEGLADHPPGPQLAATLARIDRSRLHSYDLVVLVKVRSRQVAHEQAEVYADMVAVADRVTQDAAEMTTVCASDITKFAAAEIAAALACTKRSARDGLENALLIVERLPQIWEALHAGLIDTPKAKVFAMETRVLDQPTARRIAADLLPDAPWLTTGQLAYRLRRRVLNADPQAAKNNYEQGVEERKVVHRTNPDGTGTLSAFGLPIDRAAAAYERLDGIARAAKHDGDGRPMDQIRADTYLSLLDGTWTGPGPIARRGVVEVTCDLPTLMGLADHPADLDGWGPVIADIARHIAAATTASRPGDTIWRFSVTDPISGRLLHHGVTRARPNPHTDARASTQPKADTTEVLHTTPHEEACTGPPPNPREHRSTGRHDGVTNRPSEDSPTHGDAHAKADGSEDAQTNAWADAHEDTGADAHARGDGRTGPRAGSRKDPRRTLTDRDKAYVIARDRTCRGPGCRTPARRSEIDHIIEHSRGGPSRPWNADAKCGHCHDLKDGGWTTSRDELGQTQWTSRLGHRYTVPPEPITPPAALGPLEHHLFTITRMRT